MHISHLSRIGIPQLLIDSWSKEQGEKLLPLQRRIMENFESIKDQNLIISAPTSSGKTFCAEMIAATKLFKGKKVLYAVPLKAIAEEKYWDFKRKYSNLGIKVTISTRDRQEFDYDLEKGNFDLAILVYEKFNQLLIKNIDILGLIDLVIVDELQMIGSDSRGAVLELALTKVLASKYKPQILALSAVLKDFDWLCSWLKCKLVLERNRPIELRQGILLNGEFVYREYNSGREGKENLVDLECQNIEELLLSNVQELIKNKEQVLVFSKSKQECEILACLLAEKLGCEPAYSAIEELEELEQTTLRDRLLICLKSRIAFHNADLSFEERDIVEKFYLKGEIRAIFSTTTLAMGINLPAKTVFIEAQKYKIGQYSDKLVMCPLAWSEYENMSGRAGRFGLEKDFGRSILLAIDKFHFESLWEQYIEEKDEKITSQLKNKPVEDVILDLVCSGIAKDKIELEKCLSFGLNGKNEDAASHLNPSLENLISNQMITLDKNGKLFASGLARICVAKGAKLETASLLREKLKSEHGLDATTWLKNVLVTKDAEEIQITLTHCEMKTYQQILTDKVNQGQIKDKDLINLSQRDTTLTYTEARKIKLILLLEDWIQSISTFELEQRYSCRSGQINQITQQVSWLMGLAGSIAQEIRCDRETIELLDFLSSQVSYGLDKSGLNIARLQIRGLSRDYIWKLLENNIDSPEKLKTAEQDKLANILPLKLAKKIIEQRNNLKSKDRKTEKPRQQEKEESKPIQSQNQSVQLKIDSSACRDKFLVWLNGKKIPLSAKSFKYLIRLVWGVSNKEEGWVHKLDFEPGTSQAKYIYRLKRELGNGSSKELIENNRLGFYRLNLRLENIQIDKTKLTQNPDAEIRNWTEKL